MGKIAVIGAGPMGLGVAYEFAKHGYSSDIYEADDRIGGMSASFDFGGIEIERYYHFYCTGDKDLVEILKELKLENKLKWKKTKMGYWYKGKIQPWGNPFALLTFDGLDSISKFRYGLHIFLSTKRKDWKPLDKKKAIEWIKKWEGKKAYRVLWEKLFKLKFYEYSNEISAAWIWSRIKRVGQSRYNIFEEKLGYLEGGTKTLLNAIKNFIENKKSEFRLKSPVEKVIIEDKKVKGIISNGKLEKYDIIISTVPLPIVPSMIPDLPEELLKKYRSVRNISCVCVIAKLKKSLSENFWLNVNDDEMDIPGIIEYGNLNSEFGHIVYVPFYMPQHYTMFSDKDEIFKIKVKNYLKKINPEITEEDVEKIAVNRYTYAQPVCNPNFLANLPDVNLPIKGLWVADASYYYPEDRGVSESIGYGRKIAKKVAMEV